MTASNRPSYVLIVLVTVLITILAVFAALDTLDYSPDRFTIVVLSTRGTAFILDKETGEVWSLHSVSGGDRFVKVPVR